MSKMPLIVKDNRLTNEVIYRLNYLKGNLQQFMLVRFSEILPLNEIVDRAKKYCSRNNMRFVFIEPAIITIDEQIEEEIL